MSKVNRKERGMTAIEFLVVPATLIVAGICVATYNRFSPEEIDADEYRQLQTVAASSCEAQRHLKETLANGPVARKDLMALRSSIYTMSKSSAAQSVRAEIVGAAQTCQATIKG